MEGNLKNIDDKKMLCISILENSLVIPQDYRGLIIETLMKISTIDLAKIQSLLDRFIFIAEGTEGASEHFFWRCVAKHRMKTIPPMWEGDKPSRIPKPITFDTFDNPTFIILFKTG